MRVPSALISLIAYAYLSAMVHSFVLETLKRRLDNREQQATSAGQAALVTRQVARVWAAKARVSSRHLDKGRRIRKVASGHLQRSLIHNIGLTSI